MNETSTLTLPYARAALAVATEANAQSDWLKAFEALCRIVDTPECQGFLRRPGLKPEAVGRFVSGVLEELLSPPEGFARMVDLMIENKRLNLAGGVTKNFLRLWQAQTNQVSVEVVSAYDLTNDQRARLRAGLAKRLGADPKLSEKTDLGLGAGVVVRIGDDTIDSSLSAQLDSFSRWVASR